MTVPQQVLDLIQRFTDNRTAYHSGLYNEAQLRQEFLNPLFEALGWDVNNKQGYSERFKEVIHEDSLKISGSTKAPDYAFRLGGQRVFFVEAKKPSVDIKGDTHPAYQLRRYAWSAHLPVSILTDFEELAVYDCRIKPDKSDNAAVARIMYLRYTDLPQQWDMLAGLFAPEAIRKGALERFVESTKAKKGTAEVDVAFLAEIEGWRDLLARNIALRNPGLAVRDLNFAVQATIDRLIFLRIAEDRGIEPYGRLRDTVKQGAGVYPRLAELFREADARYNSGLFYFRPEKARDEGLDEFTLSLTIDDKVLSGITKNLYYPDSPYEFSALPANILGQVYEQFLGKVIRLTVGGQAKVEEKPEVKKAGGVYYTPTYIVDTIVAHTVGKLLEGKTPREVWGSQRVAPLRILDPACGSGTFLLQAYQTLMDWYLDKYSDDAETNARQDRIYRDAQGAWQLTTEERKRILTTHIFGVDIDPQAVEVTKLSLLLKVLEGEVLQGPGTQMSFVQERVLPDLGANIRCGNSLIGSDTYLQGSLGLVDDETMYRINAFDWEKGFPRAMAAGGFDAVIGNPPYIRIQAMKEYAPQEVEFYKQRYAAASKGNYDIYVVFVEKGLGLLRPEGRLGYILPHKFLNAQYGAPLRGLIAQGKHLGEVVHFGDQQVFENATTYTCLLFLDKAGRDSFRVEKVTDLAAWRERQVTKEAAPGDTVGELPATGLDASEWNFVVGEGAGLFRRLQDMPIRLANAARRIYQGPITSADAVYLFHEFDMLSPVARVFSQQLGGWIEMESSILRPVIRSGHIRRYSAAVTAYVLFPYEVHEASARLLPTSEMKAQYPLAWAYLSKCRKLLQDREKGKFRDEEWYRFGRTQNLGMWEQTKLMIPYMVTELSAYLDTDQDYYFINVTTGGYGITIDTSALSYHYLCGLLNSRLLDFYLRHVTTNFRGGYFAANKQYIEQLPIRTIDFADPADVARHDRMVALVERMLALHNRLAEARTPQAKSVHQQQIEVTDRAIDALVYELYGLTEEEIAVAEGTSG